MTQQDRDEIRALVLSFSTRISDLPEVVALADGDYITVVQNDGSKKHSKKATLQSLLELIKVYYPDHNGAKYQGIAHPSDANVILPIGTDGFWFAIDAGIYTNYGGIVVGNSPKVIKYNATTGEWSSDDLWGDINGTIAFRLKEGHAADSLDTYRIPVISNRDYIINADCYPAGSLGSVVITEFNYEGTLIKRTELESVPLNFIPQSGTDYIQVTLGYNHSNPIAIERSEVTLTSSLRTLVEALYNFIVDVLQGEYEARFDSLEGDISSLFSGLSSLSDTVGQKFGGLEDEIQAIIRRLTDDEGNIAELVLTSTLFQTRLSDAEGNISTLRQTADEISAQVENAQGDIARLQIRADEISAEVRNAEGDISRISQRADQIEATVANQQGDISRITQRADLIETSVSDIEGRTSTLEQTAEHIQTTVVGIQGEMSQITQRADSIESTVAGLEGDMSRITQRADSIQSVVANQAGDISSLQQTAQGFETRVSNTEGAVSSIQQTAEQISSRVSSAEGDISILTQTAAGFETRVTDAEGNISSLNQTVNGIEQRVQTAEGNITTLTTDVSGVTVRVTTAEGNISQLRTDVTGVHTEVSALATNLSDYKGYVNGVIEDIQDQIDGAIDTWFYNGTPTLSNLPASEWNTTALKDAHLGDVYYDNLTGYAYRFTKEGSTYLWTEITDSAVVDALARARNAQDTADHKRRVFLTTPYTPYDAGDLWVQGHTANNDGTIYRCVNSRASGDYVSTDWELASDLVNQNIMRANFDVLANAIIGTVAEYDSAGRITSDTATQFVQTVSDISFSVTKVGSALLPTGIDIANQKITITTDNFFLQGNGVGSDTALQIVYRDNVPKISVANLDVTGIFSTQAWTDANSAALSTFYTNRVSPIASDLSDLEGRVDNIPDLSYLKAATNNGTLISGGLVLTSLIQLGGVVDGAYKVMSGINGNALASETGYGIAAWYGGPMVDLADVADDDPIPDHAKTLFRMDGSGYLADGAISWGAAGDLHLLDNVYIGPNMDKTLASISTFVTLLSTWFEDDIVTIDGVQKHVLRVNMSGDTHDTGFAGVVWNGFLITEGDQIVGSGTPGGGGGGGAGYLHELDDVELTDLADGNYLTYDITSEKWVNVAAPSFTLTPATASVLGGIKVGSGLSVTSDGTLSTTNAGTVTAVKVGTTTYNPTSGVVSLPAYPTVPSSLKNPYSLTFGSKTYDGSAARTITASDLGALTSVAFSNLTSHPTTISGYGITDAKFGTAGSDYVPITLGETTINVLTVHQSLAAYLTSADAQNTYQPIISDLADIREGANLGSSAYQLPTSGIPKTDLAQAVQNSLALADSSIQAVYDMTLQVGGTTIGTFQSGEEDKTLTITAQNLYDAIGSTKYHPYGGSNSDNTFVIGGATFTWHPASGSTPGYLELNSPFLTQGDQIVGSGTPGQGGGGGAGYLYELNDVADSLANPTNGMVLQYNGTEWIGVAASSIGRIYSPGIGISIDDTTISNSGVRSTTINGNYLRVNTNGTNADLTIPYATTASRLPRTNVGAEFNLNTALSGGGLAYNYGSAGYWVNGPSGMSYGGVAEISQSGTALSAQFAWDIVHNVENGTRSLWYRAANNLGWCDWAEIYTSKSLTQTVVTNLIGTTTYAPYNANGYLPLTGGQMAGTIWRKMTVDTSNYENAIGWQNAAGTSTLAYIGYYNTVQKIFINAIGASEPYTDTVGKYSLVVGNNVLTYNTYPILRSDNYTTWINTTNFPGLNKTGTVTSVATGTGLTGGTITGSGTISINSTYQTYISHGESAYNSLSNYVLKAGDTMTGNLTINGLSDGNNVAPLMINDAYASETWARFIQALYPNLAVGAIPNIYFGKDGTARNGVYMGFYYAGSGSTSNLLTLGLNSVDHVLTISGGENVGIGLGTTPASAKLHVAGNIRNATTFIGSTAIGFNRNTETGAVLDSSMPGGQIHVESDGKMVFGTMTAAGSYAQRCFMDASGNVGIGTASPTHKLHVNGDIYASSYVTLANNMSYRGVDAGGTVRTLLALEGNTAYVTWGVASAGYNTYISGNSLFFTYGTSHTIGMTMDSSGNVGIGTTMPSYKFDVAGDIYSSSSIFATSALFGGANGVGIGRTYAGVTSGAYDLIERAQSGGTLYFQYNHAGDISMCQGGGNVGIGITPSYKLHVNGTVGCGGLYCASTSSTAFAQVVNNTTMNWPISMAVMTPNLPVNGTHGFMVGRANSSGNTGIVSFRYVGAASTGNSISLGFHSKDFIINAFYSGNVTIGTNNTTDYGQKLYVAGNIHSTGDQVVSSDATLKTNLKDITYSVADIAKAPAVTFDWKDGRGRSAGSIAQYWKDILPELVHGEEGNMSLAYGQLALVNSILIARHETEQDKEIARLKNRVAELEKQLRLN